MSALVGVWLTCGFCLLFVSEQTCAIAHNVIALISVTWGFVYTFSLLLK
jgi:hypothetical protein